MAVLKKILATCGLLAVLPAQAAFLDGQQISYEYLYPDSMTQYWPAGAVTVGAGIELNGISAPGDGIGTVDFGDDYVEFVFATSTAWNPSSFNGVHIFDLNNNLAAFSVSLDPGSNMVGLSDSNILFDDDHIFLNWQGLAFDSTTKVRLNLTAGAGSPVSVPEPGSAALLLLGALGLWSRRNARAV